MQIMLLHDSYCPYGSMLTWNEDRGGIVPLHMLEAPAAALMLFWAPCSFRARPFSFVLQANCNICRQQA